MPDAPSPTSYALPNVVVKKLEESGLTIDDGKRLHIRPHTPDELKQMGFPPAYAFAIPYFTPDGKPNCFYRLRYMTQPPAPPPTSFKSVAPPQYPKYLQPRNTPPRAYFPPLTHTMNTETHEPLTWGDIALDPNYPLIVTEGELKAACSTKYVMPTIGLGGVWSFMSKRFGFAFLPELEQFSWLGRRVFIIYDSDSATNPKVVHARDVLYNELFRRGAAPMVVDLPTLNPLTKRQIKKAEADPTVTTLPKPPKTGLDDYIVANMLGNPGAKQSVTDLIDAAQRDDSVLSSFSRKHAYITSMDSVVNLADGFMRPMTNFRNEFANLLVSNPTSPDKKIPMPALWMRSPTRRTFNDIVMEPGEPPIVAATDITGASVLNYNAWRGWGVRPREGDATPFLALLAHLFPKKEEQDLILDWLAYPLQNPGAKLPTALVIVGGQGTGKSLLLRSISYIYGDTAKPLTYSTFESDFTGWMEASFVVWDEFSIGTHSRKNLYDKLKDAITANKVTINKKFQRPYEVKACFNLAFTTNYHDGLPVDADDRRFMVLESFAKPNTSEFYNHYLHWINHGGASIIFDHLLHRDLSAFDATAPAPLTDAKLEMAALSHGDAHNWCRDLLEHPEMVLIKADGSPLNWIYATAKDLVQLYQIQFPNDRITPTGITRMLNRAGYKSKFPGWPRVIRTEEDGILKGTTTRVFKIRDVEEDIEKPGAVYAKQESVYSTSTGTIH